MPLLLANWRLLAEAAIVAVLGIWLGVVKLELASLEADVAKQKVEAANMLAEKIAANAVIDATNALNARKLDEANNEKLAVINDTDRRISDALRTQRLRDPGRRPSCPSAGTVEAATAGSVENLTTVAELSDEAGRFLRSFAREADELRAYSVTCHDWALEHGR